MTFVPEMPQTLFILNELRSLLVGYHADFGLESLLRTWTSDIAFQYKSVAEVLKRHTIRFTCKNFARCCTAALPHLLSK